MKLTTDHVVPARQLTSVSGAPVPVQDPDSLVHLQFRRFAGCPVCNLHLRSFASRNDEVIAAGVREVVVFHAPDGELRPHVADLPFAVVADPGKRLYAEFGVESAKRALLDPRAWPAIVTGVLNSLWGIVRHRRPAPRLNPHGGRFGLPADFLIGPGGHILAVKYGQHANDHWPVGELLTLAHRHGKRARPHQRAPGAEPPEKVRHTSATSLATASDPGAPPTL
jgi:peroxiredoxin